jgi:hypothetical protein
MTHEKQVNDMETNVKELIVESTENLAQHDWHPVKLKKKPMAQETPPSIFHAIQGSPGFRRSSKLSPLCMLARICSAACVKEFSLPFLKSLADNFPGWIVCGG